MSLKNRNLDIGQWILGWQHRLPSEHDTLKRARIDARAGRPHSDETELNVAQGRIVNRAQRALGHIRQFLEARLRRCDEHLQHPDLSFSDRDIAGPMAAASHELTNLRKEGAAARQEAQSNVASAKAEHTEFRKTQRLMHRSAEYPEYPLLAYGLICVLFTLEVCFSGSLLSEHDPHGLLGGWWQALLISVINILPSLSLGIYVVRGLHHVDHAYKMRALVGLILGIIWLVLLHLYVGHYRIQLGIDAEHAAFSAGKRMWSDLFDIWDNKDAVFLFSLGIFTCVVAIIDGYRLLDDPHVGYGAIDRKYRRQIVALTDLRARQVEQVKAIIAQAHEEIDTALQRLAHRAATAQALLGTVIGSIEFCEHQVAHIARTCHERLSTYREENRRICADPAPAYFQHFVTLNTELGYSTDVLLEKQSTIKHIVAEKRLEAHQALAALCSEAEAEIAKILSEEASHHVVIGKDAA